MPSGASKEEKKRKRAIETNESASQTTKKIKREGTSNGVVSNGTGEHPPDSIAEVPKPNAINGGAEGQSKAKKRKKSKEGKPHDNTINVVNGTSEATEEPAQSNPTTNSVAPTEPVLKALDISTEDLEQQRQGYLKKLRKLKDAATEGKSVGRKLHVLLKEARVFAHTHTLPPDDAVVQLIATLKDDNSNLWRISPVTGGRFIDHDPIFSTDEKYIILATANSIHVYDAEHSLLERTIPTRGTTCFALSPSNPDHVYVGNWFGDIHKFDWTTGEALTSVEIGQGAPIRALAVIQLGDGQDAMFSVQKEHIAKEQKQNAERTEEKPNSVLVLRKSPSNNINEAPEVLLRVPGRLHSISCTDGGNFIALASDQQLTVGSLPDSVSVTASALPQIKAKFHWRHLKSTHAITCLDTFSITASSVVQSKRRQADKTYNVAIGNRKGEVLVYEDILGQLDKLESESSKKPPHARVLRWHREAPSTVKWSLDGNYVISGGNETVLCLWQLETGRRQDLPHLTAAIKSLKVSPSGSSYAVQLSDNSVIVLSTAELQAKTHIAGPQSLCIASNKPSAQQYTSKSIQALYITSPLLNNPRDTKELLLAVPIEQQVGKWTRSSPTTQFLQTYNLQASRHISRQALTRNLATEANIDPDGNKLTTPNVILMQISSDGKWLATVDEWMPPAHTVEYLATDREAMEIERRKRRETYLKFWKWNQEMNSWSLNTRIAQPHADYRNEEVNKTFHLVSHPTKPRFATIGEDNDVRVWRPRRNGDEVSWIAKTVVKLGSSSVLADETMDFLLPASPVIGRLAYSNDGSVLAACQQDDSPSLGTAVHLLDAESGEIKGTEMGLTVGHVVALGFLGRHLILLSDELRVWDAIIGAMVFSKPMGSVHIPLSVRLAATHLAVSEKTQTFAVAGMSIGKGSGSSVLVFKPTDTEPVIECDIRSGTVSALISLADGSGFVVLDSQAEIRTLTTQISSVGGESEALKRITSQESRVVTIHGEEDGELVDAEAGAQKTIQAPQTLSEDHQSMKSEALAKVFATSSDGLGYPSIKDMFSDVARLAVRAR